MTTWIKLQPEDLNDYLVAAQINVLRTKALASGQGDPMLDIIEDVSTRIRAEIRGNPANRVSNTVFAIPPELIGVAAALIIESAQGRIPGLKSNADQIRAANNARDYLRRLAKGDVPISTPDDPEEPDGMQRSNKIEIVHSRADRIRAGRLRGL